MSGETEKQQSGWTVDTAHQHLLDKIGDLEKLINQRFIDNDKAVQAALVSQKERVAADLAAAKEAVGKAEAATDKRFESVNEFRKTLSDQTASFLPRPEYNANHKALEKSLQDLTDRINIKDGASQGVDTQKEQQNLSLGKIIAVVGVAVSVAGLFITIVVLAFNN